MERRMAIGDGMIGTERSDISQVALIAAEAHQVAGFILLA
jgi:hypothetical protein